MVADSNSYDAGMNPLLSIPKIISRLHLEQPWRLVQDSFRLGIPRFATQLAFSSLFALVPLLALSIQALLLLPGASSQAEQVIRTVLDNTLPSGLESWVPQLLNWVHSLQDISVIGMVLYMVSSMLLMRNLIFAVNTIWQTPIRKRNIVQLWLALILVPVGLGVLFFLFTLLQSAQWFPSLFQVLPQQLQIESWFPLVLLVGLLSLFYVRLPNRTVEISKGLTVSMAVSVLIVMSSKLFVYWINSLPSLKLMTGVVSSLPLLLVWIYWVFLLLLLGTLFTRYWQLGPLPLRRLLSLDQWLDLVRLFYSDHELNKQDQKNLGLTDMQWHALIGFLNSKEWLQAKGSDRYILSSKGQESLIGEWLELFMDASPEHQQLFQDLFDVSLTQSAKQWVKGLYDQ